MPWHLSGLTQPPGKSSIFSSCMGLNLIARSGIISHFTILLITTVPPESQTKMMRSEECLRESLHALGCFYKWTIIVLSFRVFYSLGSCFTTLNHAGCWAFECARIIVKCEIEGCFALRNLAEYIRLSWEQRRQCEGQFAKIQWPLCSSHNDNKSP